MKVDIAYPHIEKPEGEPARIKRFPRFRVMDLVISYLTHGWSAEEMCQQYPHLSPSEVHSAMTYFYDHEAEIEGEIRSNNEAFDQARAAAVLNPSSRHDVTEGRS